MASGSSSLRMPDYQTFTHAIAPLALPLSSSALHGVMCGYLCAGAIQGGEHYLHALLMNQNEPSKRLAKSALFTVYTVSQQQITGLDFSFQLMLPSDEETLMERARAFSEWCNGFTRGLATAGVHMDQFQEQEAKEAAHHIKEFAELDYEALQVDEEDERALMEVSEYARVAVLRLYSDLLQQGLNEHRSNTTH